MLSSPQMFVLPKLTDLYSTSVHHTVNPELRHQTRTISSILTTHHIPKRSKLSKHPHYCSALQSDWSHSALPWLHSPEYQQ